MSVVGLWYVVVAVLNISTNSLLGDNIKLSPLHTLTQQRGLQVIILLLSCQPRVTVTSCFVYKVIRDLESIDHLCINPIHRIGLIHT